MTRVAYTFTSKSLAVGIPRSREAFAAELGSSPNFASRDQYLKAARSGWTVELHEALAGVISHSRRILSVGSGRGEHDVLLVVAGFDVTASDFNIDGLAEAARLFPELKTRYFDVFDPDVSERYDDVLVTGLDYALTDLELVRALNNLSRVLEPDGRILLVHRYLDTWATRLVDWLQPAWAAVRRGGGHELVRAPHGYRRQRKEIAALADRAGFKVQVVAHSGFAVELTRLGVDLKTPVLFGLVQRLDRRLHVLCIGTIFELTR